MLNMVSIVPKSKKGTRHTIRLPVKLAIGANTNAIPVAPRNKRSTEYFLVNFAGNLELIKEPTIPPIASATMTLL